MIKITIFSLSICQEFESLLSYIQVEESLDALGGVDGLVDLVDLVDFVDWWIHL